MNLLLLVILAAGFLACTEGTEVSKKIMVKQPVMLKVTFTTTAPGTQKYSPKHVLAVWVENEKGEFVKTLGRWAGKRKKDLKQWYAVDGSDTDGVTGATNKDYGTQMVKWNMKDRLGAEVADGKYTIRFELSTKKEFNRTSIEFEKNADPIDKTIAEQDGYKDITVSLKPLG